MPPFRVLAVQVAGLQEAVADAVERFQTEVVQVAIDALRGEVRPAVAAEVAAQLDGAELGGTLTHRRVVLDFGTMPRPEFWAMVDDDTVTPDSGVTAWAAPTVGSKADDEIEMDVIQVWGRPQDGAVRIRVRGLTGFLAGEFAVNYLVTKGG